MKRVLSLLLAIVMVFGLIPMAAFADGEPIISFETTFVDTMTVGDTFTVTGSLANNPGIATMTLSLQWNEDAVKFSGFETEYDEDEEADVLKSDVFGAMATVVNHNLGIIAGSRTQGTNTKKNGTLFVANFEIVGSGDLDIALKDADATEFEMANADMEDIAVTFDYSAIENLSVAAPEAEGPAIPDGAPFTAITTDAGNVTAITYQEDVSVSVWGSAKDPVPYYHVSIPEGATEVYITHPSSVDPFCDNGSAYGYYADAATWSGDSFTFACEAAADGYVVTFPVVGQVDTDWDNIPDTEVSFVADEDGNLQHAIGMEKSNFAPICFFTFEYGASSEPEEPAEPTVSEIPAGAAFVDLIARVNGEDKPVTIEVMEDHYKVLVPLGTTAVYVIYDEGVPVVDEFGYAAVRVTGVDGVTEDGYSQTTSGGKTTVGLLMNKAAANGAPVTINLISLDYENRSAVGIKKADESAEDWFSFTYQLADGEHFAILPLSTDSVGYYVTGDPIASNGYTFTVELEEGYQADSNFAVKVNGETVATAPGEITLETVSEDIRVTVEGVSKAQDSSTDLIFTVDLTNAPDGMWGDIMIQDNEWNFIEEGIESGKKSTAAISARNNQYTKARIYGINTDLIAGWDINGTVYPTESGKIYTDDLTIWPRGTYMQVECSSTNPITVTIKPVLAEVPTTYTITAQQPTGGTVTVLDQDGNEITQAAEGDGIFLQYEADEGYRFKHYLINGTVKTEDDLGMTNGFYLMPAENITVTAVFESTAEGYFFATSADVSAENGGTAVVHVKITGHSDENITGYNAYDVTLTFDTDKLELATDEEGNYIYSGAVKTDNGSVTVNGNTIRIVGCGADKAFGTEIAALTFKTKAEGNANVTISKVQVSDNEESVKEDAPEATPKHDENDTTADTTPDQSVVLVPYTVTKPDFVSGETSVLHGEDYTFSYKDTTNYTYSGLTVTVGGTAVTPTEVDGVYTIANVTGAVVIESTQTPNSYDVTKPTNVTFNGPDKATYGTDYVFTVTPGTDMAIDTVTVATASGVDVPYTINENGEYVIAGTNISGPFTITVTQKDKMTTITFTGVEETEVEGGLTQSAEIGKDFNFKLIKEAAYNYTVMVGGTQLSESTVTPGQYTIPANLVVKGGVTVNITKADSSMVVVDVHEYINLDGKAMFLVTAKWRDRVLSYGEGNTMFWSSKYTVTGYEEAGAYCWLVVSTDALNTKDAVKTAAAAAIVEAAAGTTATSIGYDYDINETTKVDINDAQLAYDMYNASYMGFTENLPMLKFLEADVSTNMKLDVNDVAAVINFIVNGAAN